MNPEIPLDPIPLRALPDPAPGTPEPPPFPVVLEDMYLSALIGHTVAADAAPRFCYSLNRLAQIEQRRSSVSPERARELTWIFVQRLTAEHGEHSPLFIDDAAGQPKEKSRIIVPGRRGFRG